MPLIPLRILPYACNRYCTAEALAHNLTFYTTPPLRYRTAEALAVTLRSGGLPRLSELRLNYCEVSDSAAAALAGLIGDGCLSNHLPHMGERLSIS